MVKKMTQEQDEQERLVRERQEQEALPYTWKQILPEVDINIKVDKQIRSRDLKIQIKKDFLSVVCKGQVIMEGKLSKPVKTDDCTWTLDSGEILIHLEKYNGMEWWAHVLESDPKM